MTTEDAKRQSHLSEGEIIRYLDDEATASERVKVAEHILACAECRAEVDRLRRSISDFAAIIVDTPLPTISAARRAASLEAIREAAASAQPAQIDARRSWMPRLLRAAAIGSILFGATLSTSPVRSAFADLWENITRRAVVAADGEEGLREQRMRLSGTTIGFVPQGDAFVVEVDNYQQQGSLAIGLTPTASVTAAHIGAEPVDLIILPGGMRIANTADATGNYAVSLPETLREVRIGVADETEQVLSVSDLASTWVSVIDLDGQP